MDPRWNRLNADFHKLRELESKSALIRVESQGGNPPERYVITLYCRGITRLVHSNPEYSEQHQLSIVLPLAYPRVIPELKMLTPVWHPNIATNGLICMGHEGDRGYSSNMGLDDLVIRVLQIIRYENYSTQSALNHDAFRWAMENTALFPLDTRLLYREDDLLAEIKLVDDSDHLVDEITFF
jgi:ubiquitin-protein ligase